MQYYVSPTGDDSNPGTSPEAPWRTIAKVNSTALTPGDVVYFERGGVWRESLQPSGSGTASAPITFADYGDELAAMPRISAEQVLTGWTPSAGHTLLAYAPAIQYRADYTFEDDYSGNYRVVIPGSQLLRAASSIRLRHFADAPGLQVTAVSIGAVDAEVGAPAAESLTPVTWSGNNGFSVSAAGTVESDLITFDIDPSHDYVIHVTYSTLRTTPLSHLSGSVQKHVDRLSVNGAALPDPPPGQVAAVASGPVAPLIHEIVDGDGNVVWSAARHAATNLRQVIPGNVFWQEGSSCRLVLAAGPFDWNVYHVTIGVANGDGPSAESLVTVTFGGSQSVTVPADGTVTSDSIALEIDSSKTYVVHIYGESLQGALLIPDVHSSLYWDAESSDEASVTSPSGNQLANQTRGIGVAYGLLVENNTVYSVSLSNAPAYVREDGFYLAEVDDVSGLGQPGSYYWDAGASTLYVMPSGGDVDDAVYTVPTDSYAFNDGGHDCLVLQRLWIDGGSNAAARFTGAGHSVGECQIEAGGSATVLVDDEAEVRLYASELRASASGCALSVSSDSDCTLERLRILADETLWAGRYAPDASCIVSVEDSECTADLVAISAATTPTMQRVILGDGGNCTWKRTVIDGRLWPYGAAFDMQHTTQCTLGYVAVNAGLSNLALPFLLAARDVDNLQLYNVTLRSSGTASTALRVSDAAISALNCVLVARHPIDGTNVTISDWDHHCYFAAGALRFVVDGARYSWHEWRALAAGRDEHSRYANPQFYAGTLYPEQGSPVEGGGTPLSQDWREGMSTAFDRHGIPLPVRQSGSEWYVGAMLPYSAVSGITPAFVARAYALPGVCDGDVVRITVTALADGARYVDISDFLDFRTYDRYEPDTLPFNIDLDVSGEDDGWHTRYLRFASDVATGEPQRLQYLLDRNPPTAPGVPTTAAWSQNGTVRWTWAPASDEAVLLGYEIAVAYSTDGATWHALRTDYADTPSYSLPEVDIEHGWYYRARVRAWDSQQASEWSAWSHPVRVDLDAPSVAVEVRDPDTGDAIPAGRAIAGTVVLHITASDALSGLARLRARQIVEWESGDEEVGAWRELPATATQDVEWVLPLAGDRIRFEVEAIDAAFLSTTVTVTHVLRTAVLADTTPPTMSVVVAAGAEATRGTRVLVSLVGQDVLTDLDAVRYRVNGGAWSDWLPYRRQMWIDIGETPEGIATIEFEGRDLAGNISAVRPRLFERETVPAISVIHRLLATAPVTAVATIASSGHIAVYRAAGDRLYLLRDLTAASGIVTVTAAAAAAELIAVAGVDEAGQHCVVLCSTLGRVLGIWRMAGSTIVDVTADPTTGAFYLVLQDGSILRYNGVAWGAYQTIAATPAAAAVYNGVLRVADATGRVWRVTSDDAVDTGTAVASPARMLTSHGYLIVLSSDGQVAIQSESVPVAMWHAIDLARDALTWTDGDATVEVTSDGVALSTGIGGTATMALDSEAESGMPWLAVGSQWTIEWSCNVTAGVQRFMVADGDRSFEVAIDGTSSDECHVTLLADEEDSIVVDPGWHVYRLVREGDSITLYIDGTEASLTGSATNAPSTTERYCRWGDVDDPASRGTWRRVVYSTAGAWHVGRMYSDALEAQPWRTMAQPEQGAQIDAVWSATLESVAEGATLPAISPPDVQRLAHGIAAAWATAADTMPEALAAESRFAEQTVQRVVRMLGECDGTLFWFTRHSDVLLQAERLLYVLRGWPEDLNDVPQYYNDVAAPVLQATAYAMDAIGASLLYYCAVDTTVYGCDVDGEYSRLHVATHNVVDGIFVPTDRWGDVTLPRVWVALEDGGVGVLRDTAAADDILVDRTPPAVTVTIDAPVVDGKKVADAEVVNVRIEAEDAVGRVVGYRTSLTGVFGDDGAWQPYTSPGVTVPVRLTAMDDTFSLVASAASLRAVALFGAADDGTLTAVGFTDDGAILTADGLQTGAGAAFVLSQGCADYVAGITAGNAIYVSGDLSTWTALSAGPVDSTGTEQPTLAIRALQYEADGSLLLGAEGGIVNRIRSTGVEYVCAVPDDAATAIAGDGQGTVWIGTSSGRIFRWSDGELVVESFTDGATIEALAAVGSGQGPVVAVAAGGGVWLRDSGGEWRKVYDAAGDHWAGAVAIAEGYVVLTAQNGVVLLVDTDGRVQYGGRTDDAVVAASGTPDGLVITDGDSMYRYAGRPQYGARTVYVQCVDEAGNIGEGSDTVELQLSADSVLMEIEDSGEIRWMQRFDTPQAAAVKIENEYGVYISPPLYAGSQFNAWDAVEWVATTPSGTAIDVLCRFATTAEELERATWRPVENGEDLSLRPGPWVQIMVRMRTDAEGNAPQLSSIRLSYLAMETSEFFLLAEPLTDDVVACIVVWDEEAEGASNVEVGVATADTTDWQQYQVLQNGVVARVAVPGSTLKVGVRFMSDGTDVARLLRLAVMWATTQEQST